MVVFGLVIINKLIDLLLKNKLLLIQLLALHLNLLVIVCQHFAYIQLIFQLFIFFRKLFNFNIFGPNFVITLLLLILELLVQLVARRVSLLQLFNKLLLCVHEGVILVR